MKQFLLLVALLGASGRASAQAPHSAPGSDSLAVPLAAVPAAPDTVAALHRLFAAKRKRQGYATGATAVVAIGTLITLASSQPALASGSNSSAVSSGLGLALGACLTLPLIPVVAIGFGGWGAKYEQQVIISWQQHQLPRHIKRALKASYFRPTRAMP